MYGSIKATQMHPVHAVNLVANSGNTAYGVDVIRLVVAEMLNVSPPSRSLPYSTSLGCRRQPSLACHAWNHGKSPKSSPLSQQCRFHCHTWSAGESHYCVNSKGFMKFDTHANEESDEYQQKWLPLSDFVGLCSKYISIPYGSMAFILKNLPFQITRFF